MAGRRSDETALSSVTILRSDNERMKRICERALQRTTVLQLARLLIHYGVEHIDEVQAWYGKLAREAASPLPGDAAGSD
jgi:hypothetical protein